MFSVAIANLALTGPRLWFHGLVLGPFAVGIIRRGPAAWKDRAAGE